MTLILPRWLPAFLMMLIIFLFSAQPASELPSLSWADWLIKKGGHIVGYTFLAFSYWYALRMQQNRSWLVWLLTLAYALTDEFHQSFVPGRNPSLWDVLVFDHIGALISLWSVGRSAKARMGSTS